MNFMFRMAINVELMISLIEQRPAVWDKTLPAYKDKFAKETAWKEICCSLNYEFEEMEKKEQEEYNKLVMRKWTQVRDSWMKSYKKSKKNNKLTRPYIYHDQMSFLEKVAGSGYAFQHEDPEIYENVDVKEEVMEEETKLFDQSLIPTSSQSEGPKRRIEHDEAQNAKTFKTDPENRHMSFFRSLLPSLELFDDDQTLEFQGGVIRLLQVIKRGGYTE